MWWQNKKKIKECSVDEYKGWCYNSQCQRQAIKSFVGDRCKWCADLKPRNVGNALMLECAR